VTPEELQTIVTLLNKHNSEAEIAKLLNQILTLLKSKQGMTAEQEAEIIERNEETAAKLKGIAAPSS